MSTWLVGVVKILLVSQATQAEVAGIVTDGEGGEPVASALVSLTDINRAVLTDARGRYAFTAVPPGPQHVSVRRIGYSPRTLHALVPRAGRLEIDIALRRVATLLAAVEVRPPVALRGVEPGDSATFASRVVSVAAVRNHPLLAEPDLFLALGGGEVLLGAESPSGIHVRGGASDQTSYLLDGIPVFSPYHAGGTFSAWNPDALDRLQVSPAAPSAYLSDALSGVVSGVTRTPGSLFQTIGAISTTHARLTLDGPLGTGGAGVLVSIRSGFPGDLSPAHEPSYLRGESGDMLAKIEAPVFGGRARLLGYDGQNEFHAAARVSTAEPPPFDPVHNAFAWHSRSVGAEWSGRTGGRTVRVQGWRASGDASAFWNAEQSAAVDLAAERDDVGAAAVFEHRAPAMATVAGVGVRRSRTSYRVTAPSASVSGLTLGARTPVTAAFVTHERPLAASLTASLTLAGAAAAGGWHFSPQTELRWKPRTELALSAGFSRSHQFLQSLRNSESLAGSIFPADLFIGATAPGVPVARGDQGLVTAEYRPVAGMRLGAQTYRRLFDGVLLVAPRTGEPFAIDGFTTGSGNARGFSLDAAVSSARYGLVASYAWQHVRFTYQDSTYIPAHGVGQAAEAGVIVFPSSTFSVRLGAAVAAGRHVTAVRGAFEWEACNLRDRGCEFGGSPHGDSDQLGATKLPLYARLDLGLRKHWHLSVAGRDAAVALFGTVTNVFSRRNVLTVAIDPATGQPVQIEMRPFAPLVVGLDWRF